MLEPDSKRVDLNTALQPVRRIKAALIKVKLNMAVVNEGGSDEGSEVVSFRTRIELLRMAR